MFRGLKQSIPKHINEQAEAAHLARPDFYVGPMASKKAFSDRDPTIDAHMTRIRDAARENAKDRSHPARSRRINFRFAVLRKLFRRLQLRRPDPARQA